MLADLHIADLTGYTGEKGNNMEIRINKEIRIRRCPLCRREYNEPPAISRTVSKEQICSDCGTKQALTAYQLANTPTYCTQKLNEWMRGSADRIAWVQNCLTRHTLFDWGDIDAEDLYANDIATVSEGRIFSAYTIPESMYVGGDDKIWIITRDDKSTTTVLFPSEY